MDMHAEMANQSDTPATDPTSVGVTLLALAAIPEVKPGDDLVGIICDALADRGKRG